MTTKITTLQGESLFATLDLPESSVSDALASSDLRSVRTSLSETELDRRAQAESNVQQALNKGKFWLGVLAGLATIYALTSEKEKTE